MLQKAHPSSRNDKFGIAASLACSIHCLVPPLLISFGGFSNLEMLHHPVIHLSFLLFALYFAWKAFSKSLNNHNSRFLASVAVIGFIMVTSGILIGSAIEFVLVGIGGLIIASAHYGNLFLSRRA